MRNVTTAFTREKNKEENEPIFLYKLHDYDGQGANRHWAEHDTDIVFNGQTYVKFNVEHEFLSENIQGQIDMLKIAVANVNREMQGYLELYDLRGCQIDVLLVWANKLGDTANYTKWTFYIDSVPLISDEIVQFLLTTKFDLTKLTLPGRIISRNFCGWKIFKGTECAYAGGETTCNKTLQRCRELNNQKRFGGCPGIPSKRIYLA